MGHSSLKMFVSKAFLRTLHPYSLYCSGAGRGARRDRHMQKQLFDNSPPPWVGVQSRPPSLQKVVTCFLPLPTPWPGSKSRSVRLSPPASGADPCHPQGSKIHGEAQWNSISGAASVFPGRPAAERASRRTALRLQLFVCVWTGLQEPQEDGAGRASVRRVL